MTSDTRWNLADVWELVAELLPERPAQRIGSRSITWGEFDRRANALGRDLLDGGLTHQSKVGAYLYSCPEYLETYMAAMKVGMAPFNVNYRYGADEITYLLTDADAEAVVFHADLRPAARPDPRPAAGRAALVRGRRRFAGPGLGDPLRGGGGRRRRPARDRRGPARATTCSCSTPGGTTGMPKGVMWEQDDCSTCWARGGDPFTGTPPAEDLAELRERFGGRRPTRRSSSSRPARSCTAPGSSARSSP